MVELRKLGTIEGEMDELEFKRKVFGQSERQS
jgi:hypothetical protein